MPDPKSPESYSLLTYAWVIGLALWGGAANYVRKLRAGHVRPFSIAEFIGEMVIAGFAGVITFWMCELSGTAPLLTAALVGISGHMGSRAIFQAEIFLRRRNGGGSE